MGFFDRFTGGSKVNLTVAAEPLDPAPGGQVTVRWNLAGEIDDKCRAVRVGLEGDATYLVEESVQTPGQYDQQSGTYQPGNGETQEVWRSYQLHLEEQEYPAELGAGQTVFTLPAGAPPTSSGVVS